MNSTENANAEGHYKLMVLATVIGIIGVYLRFADFHYSSMVSNIILIIGVLLALKSIFAILK
jgi:hypothetical protein